MNFIFFFTLTSSVLMFVIKFFPVMFADVVTIGLSRSFVISLIQWFGLRIPTVPSPVGLTFFAIALSFFSLSMIVYGPGSFASHSSASLSTSQFSLTHFLDGAMMLNGRSFLCFAALTFSTASSFVASQPIP